MAARSDKREESVSLQDLLGEGAVESRIAGLSFEHGLKLVEELVSQVEAGSLPLDQAVLSYEKGVALIAHLRKLLSGAEERLRTLQETAEGIREEKAQEV